MIVEPKPRRSGALTGGPPVSEPRTSSAPSSSSVQAISSRPVSFDSAPYLTEFVTIS
ncbi:MAG TPA: hypothetical protein VK862_08200 [Afifellaceae bacterium]|nr:hypothetical protein [Afifellaceae bacterium]